MINLAPLEDVATFMGGSTPPRKNHLYFGGGIPWVKTTDLNNGPITQTKETLTTCGLQESSCKIIPSGTVLVAMYGGFKQIGRTGILTMDSAINQAITAIIPNKNKLSGPFLLEWLNYRVGYWKRFAGSSRKDPNITKGDVADFPVPKIGIKEQNAIIRFLSQWNLAINLTEKLFAEKQTLRNGLMHQLLTAKRRLPMFTKPWRTIHLGEAFRNRVESNRTDLPLLSIAADRGVVPRDKIDRKDSSSEDKSKYLRICPGDIGYNTMRMWQGVSGLSSLEGIVSPAYTIVTPNQGIDGEFMSLLFKSIPVVHLFYRYSQGLVSDTWNLKFRHFAEIKATVPEETEQKAIASVFRSVNREIGLLQAKADALREQKKGLMQQLLTGKKRVTACAT